jgi:hypothetical protein
MKKIPIITISMLLLYSSAMAGLYRWVDDNGNVHYSDKIPPIAIKHGHIELSQHGLHKKKQLSITEMTKIAEIKKRQEEEAREQKQKNKIRELKRIQDERLLSIYSTRDELIIVFKNKITMSNTVTKLLQSRHKLLSSRLATTEIKYEKMKNPVFKQTISKKIDDMLDGLKVYQQAITENLIELNKLEIRFKADLGQFDKLMQENKVDDRGVKISRKVE